MPLSPDRQAYYDAKIQNVLAEKPSLKYHRVMQAVDFETWKAMRMLHVEFACAVWPFAGDPRKIDKHSRKYASEGLIHAAALGNIKAAAQWLDRGANVDYEDERGMTSLTISIARKRLGMAEFLLQRQADPNRHNRWGWTPTLVAVDKRVPLAFPMLKRYGANLDQYLSFGKVHFSKYIFPIYRERIYPLGLACVQEACGIPSRPVIKALLSAGAKPDITIENLPVAKWISYLDRKNSRFWLHGTFKQAIRQRS